MQQIHPSAWICFEGAECWTDGHTADSSFPLQIPESMWAQNERHLQVSVSVDFVNLHQVGSFLNPPPPPNLHLLHPSNTPFFCLPPSLSQAGHKKAGQKKNCLCAVGAEQMGFCRRKFNIATASGSVTVTDCSTILML